MILDEIKEKKFLQLEEMVPLDSSESTVRRDLDELESEGHLRRPWWCRGCFQITDGRIHSGKIYQKRSRKDGDCSKALSLIEDGDVIFIDAGTTTELLVELLDRRNLTVVTDSIHHATKLLTSI